MSTEFIKIPNCPMCQTDHQYRLEVSRAVVYKFAKRSNMNETPREVRFTRLFTCPVKNQNFQATVALTQTSSNRIQDVKVVGTVDN